MGITLILTLIQTIVELLYSEHKLVEIIANLVYTTYNCREIPPELTRLISNTNCGNKQTINDDI